MIAPIALLLDVVAIAAMPIVVVGTIERVKARWAGRRGRPILQLGFDLVKLARKASVAGETTTFLVKLAPLLAVLTTVASACIVPLAGMGPLVAFPFDFVWFAYVWGVGRTATMLGALDTGSSFEGMGVARDATFATFLEPALFLVAGALCLESGARSFGAALVPHLDGGASIITWLAAIVALVVVVQVETGRMPVDDPATHLELTMVHEVMILDHAGRDLALLQYAGALKLYLGISIVATLLDPLAGSDTLLAVPVHFGLSIGLAIGLGLVESLVARIKLAVVPQYIVVGLAAGGLALLALVGRSG